MGLMKTIIAGSRTITDYSIVKKAIQESGFNITEVVCGLAKGVDLLGEQYAMENKIPVKYFPADWNTYKSSAGPMRNEQMGDYADALIAVYENKSKGTTHMIQYATKKGLKIYVKDLDDQGLNLLDFL